MRAARCAAIVCAWFLLAVAPAAALAPSAAGVPPPEGPSIFGVLTDNSTTPARPVPGVRITVTRNATTVGTTTSDAEGFFVIAVPEAGPYSVELDPETIPDGVGLRDPDRTKLDRVVVFGTRSSRVLFPFGEQATSPPGRFEQLTNLFASGIRLGLLVGVCSVGLSLIFGTTGLVNFAHGELVTFGALVAWYLNTNSGGPQVPLVVALVGAMLAGALLGAALEKGLWRPLVRRRTGQTSRMLVSIGLGISLRYVFLVIFAGTSRTFREYSSQGPTTFGPISLPMRDYVITGICAAVLVGVGLLLQRTRLGTAVRAVADERDLAEASGIDVNRVVLAVWVGGASLSALGGVLLGVSGSVQWNMGNRLLLTIFAAVVLGGLGNAFGAMAGSLVVGVASEMSTYWLPADFKFAVALVILIAVLLVRPQGLLGRRERIG